MINIYSKLFSFQVNNYGFIQNNMPQGYFSIKKNLLIILNLKNLYTPYTYTLSLH